MNSVSQFAKISAAAGAVVWFVSLFFRTSDSHETELIQKIFLLAVLVIVPLGLLLVSTPSRGGGHSGLYSLAVFAQPAGAVACFFSLFLSAGLTAAVLASLWFFVTILIALFGAWRFLRRGIHPWEEACVDAGLFYLAVGGAWFLISRLGIQPFGFGDTIVLLTAVHFHFAGFAAPVVAGMTGRLLHAQNRPQALFRFAVVGIIGGTPLVAAGITFSPALALIGAAVISAGLMALAFLVIGWIVPSVDSLAAGILLAVSAISSSMAMVLACAYAYSIVGKIVIIDIPHMAMTHGLLNALGFATCGLLGWSIVRPPQSN